MYHVCRIENVFMYECALRGIMADGWRDSVLTSLLRQTHAHRCTRG